MKANKQLAIAILWTVIAIIIGVYFFLKRERKSTGAATAAPVVVRRDAQAETVTAETSLKATDKFVLVTLNETLIRTDEMELIAENVSSFRKLAEWATKKSGGLVVLFTIPDELMSAEAREVPEKVTNDINDLLDQAGLFSFGLKRHRLVLTQTTEGRISVGRQIEAHVFIDPDHQIVQELTGKVPQVVQVSAGGFKNFVNTSPIFSS